MKLRLLSVLILSVVIFSLSIVPTLAHEGRELGDYNISFGWRNEPAFSGLMNGPDLYISLPEPVENQQELLEGLEVAVQVEVSFGPESRTLTLEPDFPFYEEFDGVGYVNYVADLIPTLPGDYTFRVFGTIGELEVDETFTSLDGEFSTIEPVTDYMFPEAGIVDTAALLARIEALEARLAELEAEEQ
jgi:hypothetical protein